MMKVALLLLALAAPMISASSGGYQKKTPCIHCKNVLAWANGENGCSPRKGSLLEAKKHKPRCLKCEDLENIAKRHGKHIHSLVDCMDCNQAWSHLEDAYVPPKRKTYNPKPAYNPYPSESYKGGQHDSYPDPKYPPSSYKLLGGYEGDHGEVCKDCKRWKALGEEWDCPKKSGGGYGASYGQYDNSYTYSSEKGKSGRGYGPVYEYDICQDAGYLHSYAQCTSQDPKKPPVCEKPDYAKNCAAYNTCPPIDDNYCKKNGYVHEREYDAAALSSSGETTNETVQTLSWVLIAIAAALFLASIAFCAVGRRERKAHAAENVHVNALA